MKTVLLTGGSGGIGSAAALIFAKAGYNVAITYYKNLSGALHTQSLCREVGSDCHIFQGDLSSPSLCVSIVRQAKEALSRIDVLIHCAGKAYIGFFDETSEEMYDALFDINMKSAFFITREVVKDMLSRKEGRIIHVSSMWGLTGASMEVAYSASKAALNGFTKALAKELAPSGIAVIGVAPGAVDTPMNAHLSLRDRTQLENEIPMGRFMTPEEIAKILLFAASDEASSLTGQILSPNGGLVL